MANEAAHGEGYVLGHSQRELARLTKQAEFFADATRDGLRRAGLMPGMKVLDLGCGVGDVSLIAADLVGPSGEVTGIDISHDAVAIANARAAERGATARFGHGAIETFAGFDAFDAVIGRFILVHFPDPAATIHSVARQLRPGAALISMEMDIDRAEATTPFPLFDRHIGNIVKMYRAMGLSPDMGVKLYATYRAAGLSPTLASFTRIGHSTDRDGFEFLTESVRSLMPALSKLGIASADEIGIDTLSDRLAAEAVATDPAIFYPRFVVAWAHI
jgi:ubiquinone/menaquinone biosynthesis C-methylase UbiE